MAKQTTEADNELSPRDLAARAAWLSFVGGLTQDQIAAELGISTSVCSALWRAPLPKGWCGCASTTRLPTV